MRMTVMLLFLVDGRKLMPFIILRRKNLPKERLCAKIIFKYSEKG
jgi:hypothetical protein